MHNMASAATLSSQSQTRITRIGTDRALWKNSRVPGFVFLQTMRCNRYVHSCLIDCQRPCGTLTASREVRS